MINELQQQLRTVNKKLEDLQVSFTATTTTTTTINSPYGS